MPAEGSITVGEPRRGAQQDARDDEDGDRREPQPPRQHARRGERHQHQGEIAELEQTAPSVEGRRRPGDCERGGRRRFPRSRRCAGRPRGPCGPGAPPRSSAPCPGRRRRGRCTPAPATRRPRASPRRRRRRRRPPTPTTTSRPPARWATRRTRAVERSRSGAPDRPPSRLVELGRRAEPLAREGGVGDDHAAQAAVEREVDRGVDLLVRRGPGASFTSTGSRAGRGRGSCRG